MSYFDCHGKWLFYFDNDTFSQIYRKNRVYLGIAIILTEAENFKKPDSNSVQSGSKTPVVPPKGRSAVDKVRTAVKVATLLPSYLSRQGSNK